MTQPAATVPHSDSAELGVISSMLVGGDGVIDDVRENVEAGAFYVPRNRTMFDQICLSHDKGLGLDLIAFTQRLRDQGVLEQIGGAGFVTEAFTYVVTAGFVDNYMEIVREKWMRRQMIERCTKGVRQAYDESLEASAIVDDLQSDVIEIGQISHAQEALRLMADAVPEVMESIKATYRRKGKPVGISTGFNDLDRMTGGFQKGRTYYIAARPAMGKSSLGTEFAEHVAIENAEKKHPVAIFSVEMTAHELTEVVLCRRSEIDLVKLRDAFFKKYEYEELKAQAEILKDPKQTPIYIDDKGDLSILEFRARARRAVKKLKVELIIIDYIQRMHSSSKRCQMSRELEMNEIAQGISATAKELKVPIVVLAQLNRETEKRKDGRPQLADLRESGSMEAEAHFVGLLYRPAYYCKTDDELEEKAQARKISVEDWNAYTELLIAKQRRGPAGPEHKVVLRFIKEYAKFESEDPNRPLYSNRPEERQQKTGATDDPAGNAELSEEDIKEVFPGSHWHNGEEQ